MSMFTHNAKTDSPVQIEDTTEDSKDLPAHKAKRDVQLATQMVIASSIFLKKKLKYEMRATS